MNELEKVIFLVKNMEEYELVKYIYKREKTIDEALEYIRKEAGWYSDAGKFEFGLTEKETLELYNILIKNKDEIYKTLFEAEVRDEND